VRRNRRTAILEPRQFRSHPWFEVEAVSRRRRQHRRGSAEELRDGGIWPSCRSGPYRGNRSAISPENGPRLRSWEGPAAQVRRSRPVARPRDRHSRTYRCPPPASRSRSRDVRQAFSILRSARYSLTRPPAQAPSAALLDARAPELGVSVGEIARPFNSSRPAINTRNLRHASSRAPPPGLVGEPAQMNVATIPGKVRCPSGSSSSLRTSASSRSTGGRTLDKGVPGRLLVSPPPLDHSRERIAATGRVPREQPSGRAGLDSFFLRASSIRRGRLATERG